MAEEKPHIEIKIPPKPINSSREQYLFENENLIIGSPGFVFREYPTLKERLKENINKYKSLNNSSNSQKFFDNNNLGKNFIKNIQNNNTNIKIYKKNKINKNNSDLNILYQPVLRFKNRTDFERICDTIQQYCKPKEQESIDKIRKRHVKSIDFPTNSLYKDSFRHINLAKNKNKSLYNHSLSSFNIYNSDKNKLLKEAISKDLNLDNNIKEKIQKFFFTRKQRLNYESKKIRSNLHLKTHFKGVESAFINPKHIYEVIKNEENLTNKKMYNSPFNYKIEKNYIEKRNEYKNDIEELILEEKEKQNLIRTREFSNYLNNKKYYNDKAMIINNSDKRENEKNKIQNLKSIQYLKRLAFQDKNNFLINNINETGNNNTDNTSSDRMVKNKRNDNYYKNENIIKIGGKVYHLEDQVEQIAKEVLNKCRYHSVKK